MMRDVISHNKYPQEFKGEAALLMADIDHFKNCNDTYEHLAGETALAVIGDMLRQQKGNYDYVDCFGGE